MWQVFLDHITFHIIYLSYLFCIVFPNLKQLGSCSNITLLSLCGNYLEVLPDEIGRIRNLTVLNLSNNKLKYLPYSFTKLKKLQAMWLSDNQVSCEILFIPV